MRHSEVLVNWHSIHISSFPPHSMVTKWQGIISQSLSIDSRGEREVNNCFAKQKSRNCWFYLSFLVVSLYFVHDCTISYRCFEKVFHRSTHGLIIYESSCQYFSGYIRHTTEICWDGIRQGIPNSVRKNQVYPESSLLRFVKKTLLSVRVVLDEIMMTFFE